MRYSSDKFDGAILTLDLQYAYSTDFAGGPETTYPYVIITAPPGTITEVRRQLHYFARSVLTVSNCYPTD